MLPSLRFVHLAKKPACSYFIFGKGFSAFQNLSLINAPA
jgi:hypothetical protein